MKVTIIGAGIGGLTAALVLHRAGHQVSILERAPRLEPLGAGIVLAPNAIRILQALGVNVEARGRPLKGVTMQTAAGAQIQAVEFDQYLAGVGQVLAFHRAELHSALLTALPNEIILQLGCEFDNGMFYDADALDADVLVGADGTNSAVRRRVPGAKPLRYSGYTCWRVVLPDPGIGETFEAWGGAARVGAAPLTRNRIYVFLVLAAPAGMPRQTSLASIQKYFQAFSDPVPRILEAARDVTLLHHDIEEMEAPVWGQARTVLIGDAAHAMTPNLGQGAAMAIEDAAVLPESIASDDPADALRRIRHERVAKVLNDSRRLGRLAQMKNPVGCWLRNALVRHVPRSFSRNQYLRLIEPGLEIAERTTPQ